MSKRKAAEASIEVDAIEGGGKKKAKSSPSAGIVREETKRVEIPAGSGDDFISIISSNVAGLRALLNSEEKRAAVSTLLAKESPHILCIQEHKLQDTHLSDIEKDLDEVFKGYSRYFAFSGPPAKKGYSGVACFVKNAMGAASAAPKQKTISAMFGAKAAKAAKVAEEPAAAVSVAPGVLEVLSVSYGLGEKHASDPVATSEGRVITLEFPSLYVVNCYVPNSGQNLERLDYRVSSWDTMLSSYLQELKATKPVVLIGDLNVAHQYRDMHNFYEVGDFDKLPWSEEAYKKKAKPLLKQAGCTVRERLSFTKSYLDNGFVDSFRALHPTATGCFSYWSVRAGNRAPNRGLRLDYAIVPKEMMSDEGSRGASLHDSFILDDPDAYPPFSDHCPVGCIIKLRHT